MIGDAVLEVVRGDNAALEGGSDRVLPHEDLARLFLFCRKPALVSHGGLLLLFLLLLNAAAVGR